MKSWEGFMTRFQKGCIWRKKGGSSWYVRYTTDAIVDGKSCRVQKNEVLCAVDRDHASATCKNVRDLAAKVMDRVNATVPVAAGRADIPVTDFWEKVYLPFVTDNMRASTVSGYKQIWGQHLATHFKGQTIQGYQPHVASDFLTSLTKTQGRRTLNHIRSLMSGVFTHAVNKGRLKFNPIRDVKILGRVAAPKQTPHYTLEETENIISALVDHVDCQTIVALSFFAGLRPSEIAGLQWGDIEDDKVHIRRACVRGVVGSTKTPESVATLPLLPQVLVPLSLWQRDCLKRGPVEASGWVFMNEAGNPAHLKDIVSRTIRPAVKKAGLKWKGLYAGRRGAATAIIGLTNGNFAAAQELLRHKHMSTTLQFYKKQTQSALADGLKALGAAATEK